MVFGNFSQQFSNAVHDSVVAQMRTMAQTVVSITQRAAPKRTGFMALQERYELDESSYEVRFIGGAPYDLFVEMGTRHMRPQPHWRVGLNAVGTIWGWNTELAFPNTIQTDTKLLAHGPTFQMHKSLTDKQKAHVRAHLKPVSERHFIGNVSRAKLTVRHRTPF